MLTQIVKFDIKAEHVETFKAALLNDQKGASNDDGCLEMRLFQDKKQPSTFFAYERFKDNAALINHAEQTYSKAVFDLVEQSSQSLPQVMKLSDTAPAPLHENNPKSVNAEDDVFIIFFIFKIKPEHRKKLLTQFDTHVTSTRNEEEGNIIFDLYTVEGQNDTLAVYEHWRKESDVWDIHFNQPYAVETGKLMHEAVVGDLEQYMNFVVEI
jgi:quinol monooxygenase YgiN